MSTLHLLEFDENDTHYQAMFINAAAVEDIFTKTLFPLQPHLSFL